MRESQLWDQTRILYRVAAGALTLMTLLPAYAFAARERPWLPTSAPAFLQKVAKLPPGKAWHDVIALPDQTFILQREAVDNHVALVQIDAVGRVSPYPGDSAANQILFAPSAITRSDDGDIFVVNTPLNGVTSVAQLAPTTAKILQLYKMPDSMSQFATRITSIVVKKPMVYLVDERSGSLFTLNIADGEFRRFFTGYPMMMGQKPMIIAGHEVRAADGRPLQRNTFTLALQEDGSWLYLQTPTGPLYRVSTSLLRDARYTDVELMDGLTEWRGTPTIGGMTRGPNNMIVMTDRTQGRLLAFDAGRHPWVLSTDTALTSAATPAYDSKTHAIYVPSGHDLYKISLPSHMP